MTIENPFKAGDYARCVSLGIDKDILVLGEVYRVEDIKGGCVHVRIGTQSSVPIIHWRFERVTVEPVKAPEPEVWVVSWKFRTFGTRDEAVACAREMSNISPGHDCVIACASTIVRGTVLIEEREPVVGGGVDREFNAHMTGSAS